MRAVGKWEGGRGYGGGSRGSGGGVGCRVSEKGWGGRVAMEWGGIRDGVGRGGEFTEGWELLDAWESRGGEGQMEWGRGGWGYRF
jgi:hypothetical protein